MEFHQFCYREGVHREPQKDHLLECEIHKEDFWSAHSSVPRW